MVQNQLLFMCKLDGCFLAIIITEEKLEKYKEIEKTRRWTVKKQTAKSDEQNLTKNNTSL